MLTAIFQSECDFRNKLNIEFIPILKDLRKYFANGNKNLDQTLIKQLCGIANQVIPEEAEHPNNQVIAQKINDLKLFANRDFYYAILMSLAKILKDGELNAIRIGAFLYNFEKYCKTPIKPKFCFSLCLSSSHKQPTISAVNHQLTEIQIEDSKAAEQQGIYPKA